MADSTFFEWRRRRSDNIMETAEDLLDKLERVSDLLTEIDDKYIKKSSDGADDMERNSIMKRFHDGLDSARNLVGVLKSERWRLSKREMSLDLRMGELEDYKSHLKTDMSNMNETVEVLSLRVVQLENSLCEEQMKVESLEAELGDMAIKYDRVERNKENLEKEKEELKEELKQYKSEKSTECLKKNFENMKLELSVLQEENQSLKHMIRQAEDQSNNKSSEDQSNNKSVQESAKQNVVQKENSPEIYL
ncbi:intracellular protein transport protein USO1-like [Gigantopelta aegis]|uniref:intracellular protein transport protein USO1-like n=1 Tax=Gigantopelta aegis TaxID=1735272 RepID=UPI001B888B38|nr:intracellular protein transport protein USO1-like [Gigantopelta aegis]